MIASVLRSSSAGAIFLFVPLFVLQLFVPQVSLNSSAPIGQDGQDGHGLVSLHGGDDDPKYLECKSRLDGDASAAECLKTAEAKYPTTDDKNRCRKNFFYVNCTFLIACSQCTSDATWAWVLVVQGQLDASVSSGACKQWASECPHLANCPTKPTTATPIPTSTPTMTISMDTSSVATFPVWIAVVAGLVTVLILALLVWLVIYIFVFKSRKLDMSKSNALKNRSSTLPRTSTGKRPNTGKVNYLFKMKKTSATKNTKVNRSSIVKSLSMFKVSSTGKQGDQSNRTSTTSAPKQRPSSVDRPSHRPKVESGKAAVRPKRFVRRSETFRKIRREIEEEKRLGIYKE